MPRTETILRVFVASPSDLEEERNTLEDVIRELNITWSKTLGIRSELVRWETHTFPTIAVDAQAAINQQIADDYDIFIGLMWARFGTRTGRVGSGTAEEFYRAYDLYRENPARMRIMFYFKDAPLSPSNLDPEQLAAIRNFQHDLGEKGTYYWTYSNRDDFAQLVRMHLGRQVQEWGKSWGVEQKIDGKTGDTTISVVPEVEEISDEDAAAEEGFLDLLEVGEENFESMTEAMARMTHALQDLGSKINVGTEELNNARRPNGNIDIKQAKRSSNRVADALNNFAALMEVDVPVYASSFSIGIDAFSRATTLAGDFGPQEKESLNKQRNSVQELRVVIGNVREHMQSFRDSIAATPRATTVYNRARRRALFILDKLNEEFTVGLNLTLELEKSLDQLAAGNELSEEIERTRKLEAVSESLLERRKRVYEELAKGAE
ncbi:MAG: DUF4062 domain-containing protein [Acidobacteria bacterium]|nr:DUF4062 domain-containing protein [Acidobacteriota bacterium]